MDLPTHLKFDKSKLEATVTNYCDRNELLLNLDEATMNTSKQVAKLLNYLASSSHAEIHYRASGMKLAIYSYAS